MAGNSRSATRQRDAAADRVAAWTRDYVPLQGAPDEFIGPDGVVRRHWRHLLDTLAGLDQDSIDQRFEAADRRIRNMGMSYRVQGESAERSWPLSRMPLIIPESEWREIARGVEQRAELFERILSDVYGDGALIREGVLPAAAIAGSTDFLASLRGVAPPGKRWLRLYAADGCSAIAPRRRPDRATRWRTGSSSRRPFRAFTAK